MGKRSDNNDALGWGIVLVVVGAVFLLQNLFDVDIFDHIWQFWPVALIVWGLVLINRYKKS